MYTTARGAQENLNNLWFNLNFSQKPWQIGSPNLRAEIDKLFSVVKYAMEIYRTTKSINQFNTLKCSELENMEFEKVKQEHRNNIQSLITLVLGKLF